MKRWQYLIIILSVVASSILFLGYSLWQTVQKSEGILAEHLELWNNEISQKLFTAQNSLQLEKIVSFHQEKFPVLVLVNPIDSSTSCLITQEHYLSWSGLPVQKLLACYQLPSLVSAQFRDPFVWLGLFLIILIFTLGILLVRYREQQKRLVAEQLRFQQELSELSRQICHDMKSPLQSLLVLLNENSEFSQAPLFRLAVQRLKSMTQALAHKAKINYSELESVSEDSVVLQDLVLDFQTKFSHLTLELNAASDEAVLLSSEWSRIVSNVLSNACEALGANNHGRVSIGIKSRQQYLLLEIFDNGPGIPDAILQRLGKEPITANKTYGNGLGLLQSFQMAESLGGSLQIQSHLSVGTRVEIKIPRQLETLTQLNA
ncbi:MAG: sensor histidine kinase [Bdellovibrionia bacterium]